MTSHPSTLDQSQELSSLKNQIRYTPLPGSRKIYLAGQIHSDIRVPFREVELSPTINSSQQEIKNPPLNLYDTSGPYTDPLAAINITEGLQELRRPWILQRKDVDVLPGATSAFRQQQERDVSLSDIRFPEIRKPLRAKVGANVQRLNLTSEQLSILNENLSAANSRIKDVDVAEESTKFARYNILVQSGTAMLAQANLLPQSALRLLG